MDECAKAIIEGIPEADKAFVEMVVSQLRDAERQPFLEGVTDPKSVYRDKANQILEGYKRSILIDKIKTLNNIAKRQSNDAFVSNPKFESAKNNLGTVSFKWTSGKTKGLEALLAGSNMVGISGSGTSIAARKTSLRRTLSAFFVKELEDGDLSVMRSGKSDDAIRAEWWDMQNGGKGGITGDPVALRIATAANKLQQAELRTYNDAGAFINDMQGRVGRQHHSAEKLTKAGKEQWIEDIAEWLDVDKTTSTGLLKGDLDGILDSAYDGITDGKSSFITGDSDNVLSIVGAPQNMAKRLEAGRKLFFKDAASYQAYMKKYGQYATIGEELLASINQTSRNSALMERLGTNPGATLQRMMRDYKASKAEMNWINALYEGELRGGTLIPGDSMAAKATYTYNMMTNLIRMGQATMMQFDDFSRRVASMSLAGRSIFSSPHEVFVSFVQNLPESQRKEVAELYGIGADHMMGHVFDRLTGVDGVPGAAGKANELMMKLTGLHWMAEANSAGQAQMLSRYLGMNVSKPFSALNPNTANTLHRYGIGPVEWEALRTSARDVDGKFHMSYNDVLDADNDMIEKIMRSAGKIPDEAKPAAVKKAVAKFKRDSSQRMATLFSEEVDAAMNNPGAFERASLLRGTDASGWGLAARIFAQFKTFPLTSTTKNLDRIMLSKGATTWGESVRSGDFMVPSMAAMVIMGTIMGYVSQSAKDIVNNRTPKKPEDLNHKDIGKYMASGAGGGFYTDFLFGEFDQRHGTSGLSRIVGPAAGDINDMLDLYSSIKAGAIEPDDDERTKAWKKSRNLVINDMISRVPNFFWTKALLDYNLLYGAHEYVSPGYTERLQKRLQENDQEFMITPREVE